MGEGPEPPIGARSSARRGARRRVALAAHAGERGVRQHHRTRRGREDRPVVSIPRRVLRLTLLAPDIVEAILDGKQVPEVTLARVLEPIPVEWDRQPSRPDRAYGPLHRAEELGLYGRQLPACCPGVAMAE